MNIGEYIRELRENRGLSLNMLAIKAGVSSATISYIENGRNKPSLKTIQLLADALDAEVSDMVSIMNTDEGDESPAEYKITDVIDVEAVRRVPLVGSIRAGEPILATENIESYVMVDSIGLCSSKYYFALSVKGDSMNKLFPEDTTLIVEKTNVIENGQIGVVGINGQEATVKKVTFAVRNISLIPQSYNPAHIPHVYDIERDEIYILGRVVQATKYF